MNAFLANFLAIVTILAPRIQTTGDPGAGYTWSLGDLAADSARLDVDWDTGEWADPYDTEAELLALGWTSHTITGDCAATGDSADESTVASQIAALCTAGDCGNKIMRFQDSCTYDFTAGSMANTGDNAFGSSGLNLPYSNVAYVGGGMDSTYLSCNDSGTADIGPKTCVSNNLSDNVEAVSGSTFTWSSGIAKGSGSDTGSNAIVLAQPCGTLAVGDYVKLIGTTNQGVSTSVYNRIADLVSGSGCNVELEDPLRMAMFATPTSLQEITTQFGTVTRRSNVFFIGLHIGFPNIPDGVCSTLAGSNTGCGNALRLNWVNSALLNDVWIGPYGQQGVVLRANHRVSIRSSKFGDCQMCKRRGTRGGVVTNNADGGAYSFFNNWGTIGAKRMISIAAQSSIGGYQGFNYVGSQAAVSPETGDFCTGISNVQGIAISDQAPQTERGMFLGHSSVAGQGGFLIEANDINCGLEDENGATGTPESGTLFRNRATRVDTSFTNGGSANFSYYRNWFANRFTGWATDVNTQRNVLGRWNVGTSSMFTYAGTGADWDATNEQTTGAHSDYVNLEFPPSLAFRQDNPPDWWCTESGPWDGTWNFGAGDGYGGNTYKLPAQIRYEGTTCTPP